MQAIRGWLIALQLLALVAAPVEARQHRRELRPRQAPRVVQAQAPQQRAQVAPAPAGCRLRFLGAAGAVTGSMHLLETNGRRLLVDCGMRQGADRSDDRGQLAPDVLAADAMLLTHAHIDHAGAIPELVKQGFAGKIHCTSGTAALCQALLADSARIQQRKAIESARLGQAVAPRYTELDVQRALQRLEVHPVGVSFSPAPGMTVTFSEAGHLLGAVSPTVSVQVNGQQRRIAFSGDIGRRGAPLLRDPVPSAGADYVVMESTYGNRLHGATSDQKQQLLAIIEETRRRGGKVIIPAFSVDRTQQLLVLLKQLRAESGLDVPVYVDSPLSARVTRIYQQHTEAYGPRLRELSQRNGDPFSFAGLRIVGDARESGELSRLQGPAVIISAPGMANGGRIQRHLADNLGDPRNTVAVVSYMSEGTPGRALRDGAPSVCLLGQEVRVRAQVKVLDSFSGHADRNDLLWWAEGCGAGVKKHFLVHGEPEQSRGLADELRRRGKAVVVPVEGESVELD